MGDVVKRCLHLSRPKVRHQDFEMRLFFSLISRNHRHQVSQFLRQVIPVQDNHNLVSKGLRPAFANRGCPITDYN